MGSIGVWNSISPFLGGVGIASMLVSFLVCIFYNTLVAWVLWYLFHSFQNPLPWGQCPLNDNLTGNEKLSMRRRTLDITPDIEASGSLHWWLVICLASAWCVVYVCFVRGLESMGKAVYVTALFPYLVLTIFLIRALTLPGATVGLVYLFTPEWEVLRNPQVWLDAFTQIFFSISVAFGGLIAISSYNAERNNCEMDAVLVGVINSGTSLYGAIPIFSILGFKANSAFNSCMKENILALTNHFELSDQNMTVDNYDHWLEYLNRTSPAVFRANSSSAASCSSPEKNSFTSLRYAMRSRRTGERFCSSRLFRPMMRGTVFSMKAFFWTCGSGVKHRTAFAMVAMFSSSASSPAASPAGVDMACSFISFRLKILKVSDKISAPSASNCSSSSAKHAGKGKGKRVQF
ncbi:Sodium-dependent neutral amino acid transporter B(0)AT3 [Liparis tanakae]|uniref:Sodium-dependent neutral amino acid transporter B(0)AT3 n=1 Tax=Liparis tanakae TaxID=230148 RepID=A0A4Z2G6J4_9TELE|nr:Sodium-dependent neutral amino acid transporter B(0)AT3 [Liparis tanakae]